MTDERIDLDSELAQTLGFTSDKFSGWLWLKDRIVIISFIMSLHQGKGNFSSLLRAIKNNGYKAAIPTPLGKMQAILSRKGFKPYLVNDEEMGQVELWMEHED